MTMFLLSPNRTEAFWYATVADAERAAREYSATNPSHSWTICLVFTLNASPPADPYQRFAVQIVDAYGFTIGYLS